MRRAAVPLLCMLLAGAAAHAGVSVQPWGTAPGGAPVQRVTLDNERGMRLAYIDYGATLVAAEVADRQGRRRNVILSLPDLDGYLRSNRRYGAIMGRYAGRIAQARYTLDGRSVQLAAHPKGYAIHGDPDGYDKRVWQRRDFEDGDSIGSVYRLHSPDGDQHFPGALDVSVTYRLQRRSDEFSIEYEARSDQPTVLNLTNHAYFNLAGAGAPDLAGHRFQIAADRYAATDGNRVPTGQLLPLDGTALDFRRPASLSARLREDAASPLLAPGGAMPGYDHSLLFSRAGGPDAPVARIEDAGSGRRMEVWSTEPSVQLYSANGFDGKEAGTEGVGYARYAAFAFETQHLPDSPNHANFPSTVLRPGQVYRSVTRLRFSATD
jgi:aldose 1-epimerase